MVSTPEKEILSPPEGVTERPSEIPPEVEKVPGVTRIPSQAAPVADDTKGPSDDQGAPPKTITIQLPRNEEELEKMSKGSPKLSSTWFSRFWQRLIRKATHFGWKVMGKTKEKV